MRFAEPASDSDYGLVWKVQGYDDRYPEEYNLDIFERIGVYGTLQRNNLHNNYMGACESWLPFSSLSFVVA